MNYILEIILTVLMYAYVGMFALTFILAIKKQNDMSNGVMPKESNNRRGRIGRIGRYLHPILDKFGDFLDRLNEYQYKGFLAAILSSLLGAVIFLIIIPFLPFILGLCLYVDKIENRR